MVKTTILPSQDAPGRQASTSWSSAIDRCRPVKAGLKLKQ